MVFLDGNPKLSYCNSVFLQRTVKLFDLNIKIVARRDSAAHVN